MSPVSYEWTSHVSYEWMSPVSYEWMSHVSRDGCYGINESCHALCCGACNTHEWIFHMNLWISVTRKLMNNLFMRIARATAYYVSWLIRASLKGWCRLIVLQQVLQVPRVSKCVEHVCCNTKTLQHATSHCNTLQHNQCVAVCCRCHVWCGVL